MSDNIHYVTSIVSLLWSGGPYTYYNSGSAVVNRCICRYGVAIVVCAWNDGAPLLLNGALVIMFGCVSSNMNRTPTAMGTYLIIIIIYPGKAVSSHSLLRIIINNNKPPLYILQYLAIECCRPLTNRITLPSPDCP